MDKIFKYFTIELPITISYINWFVRNFPVTEFTGINKVLYLYLEYCSTLGIVAKRKYLLVFLSTDLKKLVRQYNIRVESLTANFNYDEITAFEQAVQVISTATVDSFDMYCFPEMEEDDNFKVLMAEFMSLNLKDRIMKIFTEQFTMMNQGVDTIKVAEDTSLELAIVRELYSIDKIADLDFLTGTKVDNSSDEKARLIAKTGIPAIDEDYGGMFSKALITFAGQPGAGKTRFLCAAFVYPSLVIAKVGVRFDELELKEYEIKNMLISIHIANIYKIKIPDRDINRDDLSNEQRKIVASARIDLFESGKYGRLFLKAGRNMVVETMYDEVMNFLRLNQDIQIWVVDYTGYIISKPADKYDRKDKTAIIDAALSNAKDVADKADICAILVNQFNDDGNKAADAGKAIMVGMIQGGQAVNRTSDYDLALTQTPEQKTASLLMCSTTKVRAATGFTFVPMQVDKAISRFTQINKIENRG